MSRLIRAGFARLFKNGVFWTLMICAALVGAVLPINQYIEKVRYIKQGYEIPIRLDSSFFGYAVLIGFGAAIFVSLYLGAEYSSGTIRNKLIVGHTRRDIYLSNLIVVTLASWAMCLAYIAAVCAFGIPLLGGLTVESGYTAWAIPGSFLTMFAFGALFTFVCMLCSSRAGSAVICLVLVLGLFMTASFIQMRLEEPETYSGYAFYDSETGQIIEEEDTAPNPLYPRGSVRTAFEFLRDFLPSGQGMQYANASAEHLWQMPLYSLVIASALTLGGLALFKKKDIK